MFDALCRLQFCQKGLAVMERRDGGTKRWPHFWNESVSLSSLKAKHHGASWRFSRLCSFCSDSRLECFSFERKRIERGTAAFARMPPIARMNPLIRGVGDVTGWKTSVQLSASHRIANTKL